LIKLKTDSKPPETKLHVPNLKPAQTVFE